MKRTIPLLITAVSGFVLIVAFFIPPVQWWGEFALIWFDILASIAFILGGGNLLKMQLQHISDRQPGWGYAAVTLVTFLATLVFGLLKFGAPPEQSVEAFGETFVRYPVAALPEYAVDGEIPTQADGRRLPASVHAQLRAPTGRVTFRGWMLPNQKTDLLAYDDTLGWKCTVERLASAARVPPPLAGKLHYYADHGALAFTGAMTDEDRQALDNLLGRSPAATAAVDPLASAGQKVTSIDASRRPSTFAVPESAADSVRLVENRLDVIGPMTDRLRENLTRRWVNAPLPRPLSPRQRQELWNQIESAGDPLTPAQRAAFDAFFDADWKPDQLVQAINTAGVPVVEPQTACALLAEIEAGNLNPDLNLPAPPAVSLNPDQEAAVRTFVESPTMTTGQLIENLRAAGELTDAQTDVIPEFLLQLPTAADRQRELAFALLKAGPLSIPQRNLLFDPAREQFQWRQTVGALFVKSHVVKYPWSGSYSAQGTPFWWLYEYVFQPLITTTFALLAFYVASAAFRAFRAKNIEAVLLLGTAFIILLGRTFAGYLLTAWIPDSLSAFKIDQLTVYIMSIINTAGNRAIMIGIALGIVSTSLKVLLGIDRSYLGSGDE